MLGEAIAIHPLSHCTHEIGSPPHRQELTTLLFSDVLLQPLCPPPHSLIFSIDHNRDPAPFPQIAKLIQNLSNGVLFGDKEQFMKVCNAWVEARRDPLQEFFDRLVEINNLASAGQMDEFLEYASSRQHLRLSVNQIRLLHQLCGDNQDHLAPPNTPNDPLRQVLRRLGTPKPQVDKDLDEMCALDFSRLTQKKQQCRSIGVARCLLV